MREIKEDDILNFHLFLLFELFHLNARVVLLCVLEGIIMCFWVYDFVVFLGLHFCYVIEVLVEVCGFIFLCVDVQDEPRS